MSEQLAVMERGEAVASDELAEQVVGLSEKYLPELYDLGVVKTPLEVLEADEPAFAGYNVTVKDEGLQEIGAYKVRGALTAVSEAMRTAEADDEKLEYVVAASNGNHGFGVLYAAQRLGLKGAVIEMTKFSNPDRQWLLREKGAAVHSWHKDFTSADQTARLAGTFANQAYVAAYDSVETMAGQASMAHEELAELEEMQKRGAVDLHRTHIVKFMPVGGGGAAASNAAVYRKARDEKRLGDNFQFFGVQIENGDAAARELYSQEPLTPEQLEKSCESTALLKPGEKTMTILRDKEYCDGIMTVTVAEVGEAMLLMESKYGPTEPAAALSLAGALKYARLNGTPPADQQALLLTLRSGDANVTQEIYDKYVVAARVAAFQKVSAEQLNRADEDPMDEIVARQRKMVALPVGMTCLNGATDLEHAYGGA